MFQTTHYTIRSRRLPPAFHGCRIAHLSDLHGALYGSGNGLLVQEIQKANPSLVAMTGDMADETPDSVPRLVCLCRQLCSRYPVFLTLGNHEQALKKPVLAGLLEDLEQAGVIILENRRYTVSREGASLNLYGLVTPMAYYKDPLAEYKWGIRFFAKDAEEMLGKADPSRFNILLAHNPLYYPSYREWGADLTLSGHIHGGIIRIPGLGGLLSPDLSLFPKYDGGYFKENNRHLVVSRGLGNHFLFRIMNPPELVVITLENLPSAV